MEMNNFFLVIVTTFFIFAGINTTTAGQTKGLVFSKPIFSSNLKDNIGLLERSTITEKNFSDSLDKKRDEASPDRRENFQCTHLEKPATTPDVVTTQGDTRNRAPSTVNEETLAPQSTAAATQTDENVISTVSTNTPNLYGHYFSSPSTEQDTQSRAPSTVDEETLAPRSTVAATKSYEEVIFTVSTNISNSNGQHFSSPSTEQDTQSRAPSTVNEETLAPQSTAAATHTDEDVIFTVSTNTPNSYGQHFSSTNTEQSENCCPWKMVGDAEYMISEERRNFNQSRDLCQRCGGDIAVLNKADIQEAIRNITNFICHNNRLWIGIVRVQPGENFFEWLDGRIFPENDTAWGNRQPNNNGGQQDCVSSVRHNKTHWKLNDRNCTKKFNALCQRSKQGCHPDGWTSWNGSCYKCFQKNGTWMQAKEECNNHSAHLIFIKTNEEVNFISKNVICGCNFPNKIWIGLTKENDTWQWQDGTRDFPDNIDRKFEGSFCNNKDCTVINKGGMNIKWECEQCISHNAMYICERGI